MVREYGYEYDATLNKNLWKKCKGKVTHDRFWNAISLRSGRDALKTIAREYEPMTVYMPALACDSMVLPFKMYGHKIVYYKLNKDYSIDFSFLNTILGDGLFLYMDYFGLPSISDEKLEEIKEKYPKLIFIEDRTHNLIWERKSSFKPDYVMASLRKWLNVPDGGLLWASKSLKKQCFSEDTLFSEVRLKAQCMRNEFFACGDENIKIKYRKIFSSVSDIMDRDKNPARMSSYSYEVANVADWNKIRMKRKENAECLIEILKKSGIHFIQKNVGLSDLYVAFTVDDRDFKQSILSTKGIYNTVIWPLNNMQKSVCETAKYTEKHMLAAPCDQRYSVSDMQFIGNEIKSIVMKN